MDLVVLFGGLAAGLGFGLLVTWRVLVTMGETIKDLRQQLEDTREHL